MKPQTKQILILLVPFFVFGAYLLERHIAWKMAGRRTSAIQREIEATWASSTFVGDTNVITAMTSRILEQQKLLDTNNASADLLDSNKSATLAKELSKMLAAY